MHGRTHTRTHTHTHTRTHTHLHVPIPEGSHQWRDSPVVWLLQTPSILVQELDNLKVALLPSQVEGGAAFLGLAVNIATTGRKREGWGGEGKERREDMGGEEGREGKREGRGWDEREGKEGQRRREGSGDSTKRHNTHNTVSNITRTDYQSPICSLSQRHLYTQE